MYCYCCCCLYVGLFGMKFCLLCLSLMGRSLAPPTGIALIGNLICIVKASFLLWAQHASLSSYRIEHQP
ncbi:hypothetical protein L2E82_32460 [Cichorium intybus]|uniref:Uncharacterized protein n=1 Tax=Cichorium intybus TaxID=13427 RepID=A0ACB9BHN4_CICIN|nr:hypothetical protein L2E82_32460 [Cichorium intybus]